MAAFKDTCLWPWREDYMEYWKLKGIFKPVEFKREAEQRSRSQEAIDHLAKSQPELSAIQSAFEKAAQVTEKNSVNERIDAFGSEMLEPSIDS